MYSEVEIDDLGNIVSCYCSDIMPENTDKPWVRHTKGLAPGHAQARINIDTVTAMEIKASCGDQPYQDPNTGELSIVSISQADYIKDNFTVDITKEHSVPGKGKGIPIEMKMRGLKRKL